MSAARPVVVDGRGPRAEDARAFGAWIGRALDAPVVPAGTSDPAGARLRVLASDRLPAGAQGPLAVVPAGWARRAADPPRRVVCGLVPGAEGDRAVAAATELAGRADLPLERVAVAPDPLVAAVEWPLFVDAARGADTTLSGDPARELRDHVTVDDVLVLGSRGYGPLGAALLGSVSRGLVESAPCPVIVVPRPAASGP